MTEPAYSDEEIEIIGQIAKGKRDFGGYFATITGCRYHAMIVLLDLLLRMDFTITASLQGEPVVRFSKSL